MPQPPFSRTISEGSGDGSGLKIEGTNSRPFGEDFLQDVISVQWSSISYFAGDLGGFLGRSKGAKKWTPLGADLLGLEGNVVCGGWFREGFVIEGQPTWVLGGKKSKSVDAFDTAAIVYSNDGGEDEGQFAELTPDPTTFTDDGFRIGSAISRMSFDIDSATVFAEVASEVFNNRNLAPLPLPNNRYASTDGIHWAFDGTGSADPVFLPGTISPDGPQNSDLNSLKIYQASTDTAYGKDAKGKTVSIQVVQGGGVLRNGQSISTPLSPHSGPLTCVSNGSAFFVVGCKDASIIWSSDFGLTWTAVSNVTGGGKNSTIFAIAAGPLK